jgi:hypothetical protein
MKKESYVIYGIYGPDNLCYVGISKRKKTKWYFKDEKKSWVTFDHPLETAHKRFRRHCSDSKKKSTPLQKAMCRYGVSKFIVDDLEVVDTLRQARMKERMYILKEKANLNVVDKKTTEGYFLLMENMISKIEKLVADDISTEIVKHHLSYVRSEIDLHKKKLKLVGV